MRLYVDFVTKSQADKGEIKGSWQVRLCKVITLKQTEILRLVSNIVWAYIWKY